MSSAGTMASGLLPLTNPRGIEKFPADSRGFVCGILVAKGPQARLPVVIDGDLTVRGPLTGRGALFVTDNVRLESSALGEVALVSGGDLAVLGKGPSRLVGLLVSQGNLSLSDVTVVGAVLCAGDAGRTLRMHNATVLGSPKGLQFEFALGWGGVPTTYSADGGAALGGGGLVRLKQVTDAQSGQLRDALPSDFVGRYDAAHPKAPLLTKSDFEVVLADGTVTNLAAAGVSAITGPAFDGLIKGLQEKAQAEAPPVPHSAFSQGKLSLDLNKFLRVGETLQVVYRRVY